MEKNLENNYKHLEDYRPLTDWEQQNHPVALHLLESNNGRVVWERATDNYHVQAKDDPSFGGKWWLCDAKDIELGYRWPTYYSKPPRNDDPPKGNTQTREEPKRMTVGDFIKELMMLPMDAELELCTVGQNVNNHHQTAYNKLSYNGYMVEHSSKGSNRRGCLVFKNYSGPPKPIEELEAEYGDGTIRLENLKRPERESLDEVVEGVFERSKQEKQIEPDDYYTRVFLKDQEQLNQRRQWEQQEMQRQKEVQELYRKMLDNYEAQLNKFQESKKPEQGLLTKFKLSWGRDSG